MIRAPTPQLNGSELHAPPDCAASARLARRSCGGSASACAGAPRSSGSAARSSSSGCARCRATAAAERLLRERGLGPWSVGVVFLEGLGRYDRGLVADLGLVKLLSALRGRWVEGWETAELLEPYGEWAGLASVYLLPAFAKGLVPLPKTAAA